MTVMITSRGLACDHFGARLQIWPKLTHIFEYLHLPKPLLDCCCCAKGMLKLHWFEKQHSDVT